MITYPGFLEPGVFRYGDDILVFGNAKLPLKCIRCGSRVKERLPQKLSGQSLPLGLLGLASELTIGFGGSLGTDTFKMDLPICPKCQSESRRLRWIGNAISMAALPGALIIFVLGGEMGLVPSIMVAIAGLVCGGFVASKANENLSLRPSRATDAYLLLSGASGEFLSHLRAAARLPDSD